MADAELVERHVEALTRRDLDAVMADYDDGSRFRLGAEEHVGAAAIRAHLEEQLQAAPAEIHLEHDIVPEPGGWIRLDWRALDEPGGTVTMRGYDRFLVVDGVIREQQVVIGE
jgi:hypothetical protein